MKVNIWAAYENHLLDVLVNKVSGNGSSPLKETVLIGTEKVLYSQRYKILGGNAIELVPSWGEFLF